MKPTTAVIVTSNQGEIVVAIDKLTETAKLFGWKPNGIKTSVRLPLKEEVDGQPMFKGLCGPFYGGEGVVRYEDPATCNLLSE